MKLHHGCNDPKSVFSAIAKSKRGEHALRGSFHVAPKKSVAKNYGKYLISFLMAADVAGAHVGMINKDGNMNSAVGNEIEVVMSSHESKIDFANKVIGAIVECPDGRVAEMDVISGEIVSVVS
jgi:hypothetical protein